MLKYIIISDKEFVVQSYLRNEYAYLFHKRKISQALELNFGRGMQKKYFLLI